MIQRFLQLPAFVQFFSIIGDAPRSLAATNDPASIVGDIGTRAPVSSDNRFGFRILAKFVRSLSRLFSLGDEWWKKDRC
jgi:hypothetical protein